MRARAASAVAAALAALLLAGCAAPSEPAEPSSEAPAPTATSAVPEPEPTETADPRAGWRTIETQDGLFRWQIPADWTVVDESFEAEDDLGWVNRLTVVSELGQDLAIFGSAFYGDRGGSCGHVDPTGTLDEHGRVEAIVHLDEPADLGEGLVVLGHESAGSGRIAAFSYRSTEGGALFFAGFTETEIVDGRVPCIVYSDVPTPPDYPYTSFSATGDMGLWRMDSLEQGTAYTETEEYRELMEMFRSLQLTGAHR